MAIGSARLRLPPACLPPVRVPSTVTPKSPLHRARPPYPPVRGPVGNGDRSAAKLGPAELMAIADTLATDVTPWPSVAGNVGRDWALISATDRYEAFAIWWSPGISIDLHDHGDCVGAVAVVAGELYETAVMEHEGAVVGTTTSRVRAGGSWFFSGRHVHDVVNRSSSYALSVHVYSPRLTSMTHYRMDGSVLRPDRTVAYDRGMMVA
jgi:hypothetical protein